MMKRLTLLMFVFIWFLGACTEQEVQMQPHERPINDVMKQNASEYSSSTDLLNEMQILAASSNMEIVQLDDLHFMTFGGEQGEKKMLFIETGAHAREMASVEIGRLLVHALATDPEFTQWLDQVYVVVLLNANPSGRDQVIVNGHYMWRKTALPDELAWEECSDSPDTIYSEQHPGVDLNRQWGTYIGGYQLSRCENDYPGESPLAHPYVVAEKQFVDQHFHNGGTAIAVHSPANYVVYLGAAEDRTPSQQLAGAIGNLTGYTFSYFVPGEGVNSITSFSYFDTIAQASVFIEVPEVNGTGFFPSQQDVKIELWEKGMRASFLSALEFTAQLP